jgi:hypothetical protein
MSDCHSNLRKARVFYSVCSWEGWALVTVSAGLPGTSFVACCASWLPFLKNVVVEYDAPKQTNNCNEWASAVLDLCVLTTKKAKTNKEF